jgi:F-type H+-transporting ATPase subunit gamma
VTRRRDIQRHLVSLGEIRDIMGAMRNLALLETRKLARAAQTQGRVVQTVRRALQSVAAQCTGPAPGSEKAGDLVIAVGSERGFCGDFNRALLDALSSGEFPPDAPLIVIGQRLSARLPAERQPAAVLAGPTTVEEVPQLIVSLVHAIGEVGRADAGNLPLRPWVLHHSGQEGVKSTCLDPGGLPAADAGAVSWPMRINLPVDELFLRLAEHFLYAALYEAFYGSLMAENERRIRHMESALKRLDEQSGNLRRRRNELRQEEITEEIEEITMTTRLAERDVRFTRAGRGSGTRSGTSAAIPERQGR